MKAQRLILFFTFAGLFILNESIAQQSISWQKCLGGSYNEEALCHRGTSDGGYILAGYTASFDGDIIGNHNSDGSNSDYWIVKLDAGRNILWTRCLGGSAYEFASTIIQTSDGGYLIAGYSSSNDGDVSGNHGGNDIWVVKLDGTGNTEWQKCYGGSFEDYAYSVIQTTDGGYCISGVTYSNDGDVQGSHSGFYNGDAWVVKIDAVGTIQWQKCAGGWAHEDFYSLKQTPDGGFVALGQTNSNDGDVFGNHGGSDLWMVKFDLIGNIEWQKCLGGSSYEFGSSVVLTADGGFLCAGATTSNDGDVFGNHGGNDLWAVKLDASGAISWQKCLGGNSEEFCSEARATIDGGYIFIGNTTSNNGNVSGNHGAFTNDVWVIKVDANGINQWQKCLGGSDQDYGYSINESADGEYTISGGTASYDGDVVGKHGNYDSWMVKIGPSTRYLVTDVYQNKAFYYDSDFNLITSHILSTNVLYATTNVTDVATSANYAYILDGVNMCIYRTNAPNTAATKSRTLRTSSGGKLSGPAGLAISGDTLWVLDPKNNFIHRYSLGAVFNGSGTVNAQAKISLSNSNSKGEAIWNDGSYLYILDNGTSKSIFRYAKTNASPTKSRTLLSVNGSILGSVTGLAMNKGNVFVTDRTQDKVHTYSLATLFTGTGSVNASAIALLNIMNLDATGIAFTTSTALLRQSDPASFDELPAEIASSTLVFPNPTSGNAAVRFSMEQAGSVLVQVYNTTGQEVYANNEEISVSGENQITLPLSDIGLPAGIYFIRICRNDTVEDLRLVLSR